MIRSFFFEFYKINAKVLVYAAAVWQCLHTKIVFHCLEAFGKHGDDNQMNAQVYRQLFLSIVNYLSIRNDPKFSDRKVWANSEDPDQTAPRGVV